MRFGWRRFGHRLVRPALSLGLVVLATLLLFPSIIANWARNQVYDRDAFADNAVTAFQDEAVRDALAEQIVGEIIEVAPPESISIRPLIEFVTSTVVDSVAFVEIYRDAVEDVHRDLFTRGTEGEPLALTLVDAIIVIIALIEQGYPEVSEQLPGDLGASFVELRERDWAVDLVTFGEDVDELAIVFPVVVLCLYVGAFWVSPDRRRTFASIGIGLLAVAGILLVGRDYGRDFVLDRVAFADRAVAEPVWDAYTESLVGWAVLVGSLGLATAVAATGGGRRVDVRAHARWIRDTVALTPASQVGRILRAALFIVAGIALIQEGEALLALAGVFAGVYVLYYGLSELIWLAGPATRGVTEEPADGTGRGWAPGKLALRAGSITALALAALGGAFITYQALETAGGTSPPVEPQVDACNGHEDLCDRRIDEVAFLATHNSMAAATQPGWYFAEHLTGIDTQLESGVRALLIDTWYGYDTGNGIRTAERSIIDEKFPSEVYSPEVIAAAQRLARSIGTVEEGDPMGSYLCHGFCELGATPLPAALTTINTFLDRNPGEVVLLFIQDQISPEDTAKAFISTGLVGRVYQHVEGEPFPTLGEMIERDQRVVVFADNDASGVDWYLQAFEYVHDTAFNVRSPEGFTCERNRGDAGNPLFALNHWISSSFPSPRDAERVNAFDFLYDRARQCERERGQPVNLVVVDFYETGDAGLVVDVLNGVAEPPSDEELLEAADGFDQTGG